MNEYKLTIFQGHPLIEDNDNIILLDTGSPTTIHKSDNLIFCSENYSTKTNYFTLDIAKISKMLGKEISTLLGTDILSEYLLMIDYKNEIIRFSKNDIEFDGKEINISILMNIPVIELAIKGEKHKFFLDTGAKLSYISPQISINYEKKGVEQDFYPGMGTFKTETFEIETEIDGDKFIVKYGNLPKMLDLSLSRINVNKIIGYDFFKNFKILLDMKGERLKYKKYE
jgi:hypothetical protein